MISTIGRIVSLLVLFILMLSQDPVNAQAQQRALSGVVLNSNTNQPVPDATVFIEGTNRHATTDQNGAFEIGLPPVSVFDLRASCIGFKRYDRTIDTSRDSLTDVEIRLEEDPTEIRQVDIIRNRRKLEVLSTPTLEPLSMGLSTTTISTGDIRATSSKTVIEAMAFSPGAFIETRGRKVKQFFSVRGQKYPYPEYSINGVWQREFHETPYFFSTGNVEKIEVIRSSAALVKGLSGMAGIVNIVTKKYSTPETTARLEYGSFNTLHTSLSHGGQHRSFSYSVNLGYDRTDGAPGQHSKENILNLHANLEWTPSDHVTVTANIFHLNGMRQFMQAQFPAAAGLIARLESYDPFISSSVSLKTVVKQNQRSTLEIHSYLTGRKPEFINEVTGTTTEEHDTEVGVNILETLALGNSNILRFGGLYNYWNAPNGKRFYAGRKSELQTISAVVTDEQMLGRLNINGGVRWVKTYINEFGAFNIDGSGSAFTAVDPIRDQWQPYVLQMTGGAVYDLGTHSELSLNAVSGSVRPREGALNEDLDTPENEYRTMLDAGVRLSRGQVEGIVLTGFYVNQNNAIIYSGEILALEDGRFAELYENQDQYQYGIELEVKTRGVFRRTTRIFMNLTGMRSMVREGNESVKNSELPELIANTGLNIQLNDFDLNFFGNYSSGFSSSRFADRSLAPVSLGGYFRFDLILGYTFGDHKSWRVYGSVKNLSGVNYMTVVGYPDPGRRLNLGIEYHFTRKK